MIGRLHGRILREYAVFVTNGIKEMAHVSSWMTEIWMNVPLCRVTGCLIKNGCYAFSQIDRGLKSEQCAHKYITADFGEKNREAEIHMECAIQVAPSIRKTTGLSRLGLNKLSEVVHLHHSGNAKIREGILSEKEALTPEE